MPVSGASSGQSAALSDPVPFKFVPVDVIAKGRMEAGIRGIDLDTGGFHLCQGLTRARIQSDQRQAIGPGRQCQAGAGRAIGHAHDHRTAPAMLTAMQSAFKVFEDRPETVPHGVLLHRLHDASTLISGTMEGAIQFGRMRALSE